MRMVRGFYNEQNNTVNVVHYDTNYVISLDCGKWEQGLRTTPNSQGKREYGEPKERRKTTMSRDFLRKLLIKLNADKKRGSW